MRTRAGAAIVVAATVLFGLAYTAPGDSVGPVTEDDYGAAMALFEPNLRGLVKNESVQPHWLDDDGSFWYRRDTDEGHAYVLFDLGSRSRTPLFNHDTLAVALGAALAAHVGVAAADELETPPRATDLGLSKVTFDPDRTTLTGESTAAGDSSAHIVTCNLDAMSCEASDPPTPEPGLLPSPDERYVAFRRADNLFVRDVESGNERRLTDDGAPYFSYGATPENSLSAIPRRKRGTVFPPSGTWSPDGRYLISRRVDEREVLVNPFVEWVPQDGSRRPIVHAIRTPLAGELEQVGFESFVFEPTTGRQTRIAYPEAYGGSSVLGWSLDQNQMLVLGRTDGSKAAALLRVDLTTGAVVTVLEESDKTRFETNTVLYSPANIRILGDGSEMVWYSARSGWGHLYLYDAETGALKNAITAGSWAVIDIAAVDEARREIYFTAVAREEGRDAYYRHLYKADLDGGGVTLLTEVDADHAFPPGSLRQSSTLNPTRRINLEAGVFLDTYSTVDEPPVTVVRSTKDGRLIAEVERADATALYDAGWRPPVRERLKAADGETDLYANYYAPRRDIGEDKHPVIDAVYGGPQVFVTPRNFTDAYSDRNPRYESSLARLGFAVLTVDGRGTPGRSSAFRDAGYTEFTQVGIDDHIAAIRQLAKRHPEMDVDNVGIYGWSWGGTFSAQAILSRPEFYDVAVSGAGAYDYAAMYPGFDTYTGIPEYAGGSRWRTKPNESPSNWAPLDITAMAGNLVGHLMVVYGDLDENVPPSQAFRLIDALIRADKRYDLMYLPNRTHGGGSDPYTVRRTWDYFVEHLLGEEPPDASVAGGQADGGR